MTAAGVALEVKDLWTLPSEVEPLASSSGYLTTLPSLFLCLCFSLLSTLTLPLFTFLFLWLLFSHAFFCVTTEAYPLFPG